MYVDALLEEISLKSDLIDLKSIPISSIFFGGGTPSLLKPQHIERIGGAIHKNFDLSKIREFSFEFEVKSVKPDVASMARDIGVTHARFGLQTLNEKWAKLFNLTRTRKQIDEAVDILLQRFPYQSFDVLYGMNGHNEEDLIADLEESISLGTTNIDIYPIDNVMTQPKLHRLLSAEFSKKMTASRKFSMNVLVDQIMRSAGFMPHNGHGYYREPVNSSTVSKSYSFVYHEAVYGYHDHDLLGFGTNAISSTTGHVITNTDSRSEYIANINEGKIPCVTSSHSEALDYCRPLLLRLPYHGVIEKSKIEWDLIPNETLILFKELCDAGLFTETVSSFEITKTGWFWYVNAIYYMMPRLEKSALNKVIQTQLASGKRQIAREEIAYCI